MLICLYLCSTECALTGSIIFWDNICSVADHKSLQYWLPSPQTIFSTCWLSKAQRLIKDTSHAGHSPFYCCSLVNESICARTREGQGDRFSPLSHTTIEWRGSFQHLYICTLHKLQKTFYSLSFSHSTASLNIIAYGSLVCQGSMTMEVCVHVCVFKLQDFICSFLYLLGVIASLSQAFPCPVWPFSTYEYITIKFAV